MRNLNAASDGNVSVIRGSLDGGYMFGIRKDISALVCDHRAPTPEPVDDPELPERLPDPLDDEPPVPDHNPSSTHL